MTATLDAEGVLRAPSVGTWVSVLQEGAHVSPRLTLGALRRLGRPVLVLAPEGAWGAARPLARSGAWVQHGAPLVQLGAVAAQAGEGKGPPQGREQEQGLIPLRAPMAGTLYLRPKPGTPDFVTVGASLAPRATVALVEVMKTFTPLMLEQGGVLERWVVADGAGVEPEQVLAWIRPL